MKKIFTYIVSVIMTVTMIGTASVNAAAEGTHDVASLVAEAKWIKDNPKTTSLGPLVIDGVTWRYTVKMVDGQVCVEVYPWLGLESLTSPLAEAMT
jgi:hypothetical protein